MTMNAMRVPVPRLREPGDRLLQCLVSLANDAYPQDVQIRITLQVSGFLVSGLLVSGAEYIKNLERDGALPFLNPKVAPRLREKLGEFAAVYERKPEDESDSDSEPSYIHLSRPRFYSSDAKPISAPTSCLWRGRISDVSGFYLDLVSDEHF